MTPVTLRLGGRSVTATIDAAGAVRIDDASFTVMPLAPGVYVVDDGARRWEVAVAADGDTRWISVGGQVAIVEIGPERQQRRRSGGDGAGMAAPMPASVVKVLVSPGQAVSAGETVVVLEAMKMELPVRASRDGIVTAIHCTQGELVQPGVVLVDLE